MDEFGEFSHVDAASWGSRGSERIRFPVAAKVAFATAGAIKGGFHHPEEDSRHLHCPAGASILAMERRCFLADGQTVEFAETRYRGDIYDFVVELQR